MTLGAAMFTRRGGNPLGPAGTGKTETVKDFGKVSISVECLRYCCWFGIVGGCAHSGAGWCRWV
jgi:hypothetical protein